MALSILGPSLEKELATRCLNICSVHSCIGLRSFDLIAGLTPESFSPSSIPLSRPIYVSTVRPQSKHIVVILDHGASVTDTQLQIAKDAARVILSAIDEHDKVTGTPREPRGMGSFLNVFCELPCV